MKKFQIHAMLIVINVLIFLLQSAGYDFRHLGALWQMTSPMYHDWQWLTHLFLHESVPHIVFNMYALGMFGATLAQLWTVKRFLLVYFAAGWVGAAAYLPFMNEYSSLLGASGAVYGLVAAFAVCFPRAPLSLIFIPISFQARYFMAGLVAYEIFAQLSGISLFGQNIAHMAHVGGALTGAMLAWHWRYKVLGRTDVV